MTNDELLAGFLDRSLNEDQLLEFESRKTADTEFAQQADAMIRVERVIPMAAPVVVIPTDFLHAVEADVATKVSGAASSSFLSGVAGNAWTWVTAASAVAITAGTVYVATRTTEPVRSVPTPKAVVAERQAAPAAAVPVRHEPARTTPAPSQPVALPIAVAQRPIATELAPVPSLTPSRSVDLLTSNTDPAMESLLADLQACRGSGDYVRCAQMGLAIGRTYREDGKPSLAEQYLGQALIDARRARTVQYEVDALGEMALNAMATGRQSDGKEYLLKAVSIGKGAGIDVSDWKRLLDTPE